MGYRSQLEDEFNSQMSALREMEIGSEEYVKTLESMATVTDRLIAIQQQYDNFDLKAKEIENAEKARESEELQLKKRNRIEWAKVWVPTVGAFTMGIITMIWEKTDTLTLTPGKISLRDLLSFKLK